MRAIFRRELRNYFLTPIGYVFMGVFLLMGGIFFALWNLLSGSSDPTSVFSNLNYVFMLIVPLLTMRLLSEERKTRTDQLLITSPVSIGGIVMGKYLAALTVLLISMVPTLGYMGIMSAYSTLHWGLIVSNYIGFFLLGASYIAIGVLMSSLTESQLTAAIMTLFAILMLQILESVGSAITIPGMGWLSTAISWISLEGRYAAFSTGLISIANVIYYLSFIGILLLLTRRVIDKRRWSEG